MTDGSAIESAEAAEVAHRLPTKPFAGLATDFPASGFDPAAFLAPPNNSGYYGNLGRDTLIGPGLATWDLSLLKDIPIRESLNLQFRA